MVGDLFPAGDSEARDDGRIGGKMTQPSIIKMMALLVVLVGAKWPTQGNLLAVTSWGLSAVASTAYNQPAIGVTGSALAAQSAAIASIGTLTQIGYSGPRADARLAFAGASIPADLSTPTPPALAESLESLGATALELPPLAQTDQPLQTGYPPPPPPEVPSVTPLPSEYEPPPTVRPFQLATMTPGPGEWPSGGETESRLAPDPSPRFGLYAGFGVSLLILIAGLVGMLRYGWHKRSPDPPDSDAD